MFLSIIVDISLISAILISAYLGYKRGFIRSVAKFVKFFLTFLIAFSLTSLFSRYFIEPLIVGALTTQMKGYLLEHFQTVVNDSDLPTILKITATVFDVDIASFSAETDAINAIVEKLSYPLSRIISLPISFICLYFIVRLLIRLFLRITDIIFKLPVLGITNRILGSALSTVVGFVIAWGVTVAFNFFISLPVFNEWALQFNGGIIYNFFNSFTPLEVLLSF